jgi:hypothetical protein
MTRRLVNFLTAVSLLVALGGGWLHLRQVRFGGPELELFSLYSNRSHARYTLRAGERGLGLYGPPAPVPPGRRARLLALVRGTRIGWRVVRNEEVPPLQYHADAEWFPDWEPLDKEVKAEPKGEAVAVLLEAMEDPDLFVTADVVLAYRYPLPELPGDGWGYYVTPRSDGTYVYYQNALHVDFVGLNESGRGQNSGGEAVTVFTPRVRIDPAQLPAARARWHRHLDATVALATYPAVAGGASVLPGLWGLAWGARLVRRRRLARDNRCARCGYDLRATPGRCPECGLPVVPANA